MHFPSGQLVSVLYPKLYKKTLQSSKIYTRQSVSKGVVAEFVVCSSIIRLAHMLMSLFGSWTIISYTNIMSNYQGLIPFFGNILYREGNLEITLAWYKDSDREKQLVYLSAKSKECSFRGSCFIALQLIHPSNQVAVTFVMINVLIIALQRSWQMYFGNLDRTRIAVSTFFYSSSQAELIGP